MSKAILFNDSETGGTEPKLHALLQLACIIERDGKIIETFEAKMKPVPGKTVTPEALKVNGYTLEQIATFEDPVDVYNRFRMFCARHGRKGDKENRFIMAGYCNQFDCDFLMEWHKDMSGGTYAYWDYLQMSPLDPLPTLRAMRYAGLLPTADTKLETVCKYFGIQIKAHDAMSDITATRELIHLLYGKLWTLWCGRPCGILGPVEEEVEVF